MELGVQQAQPAGWLSLSQPWATLLAGLFVLGSAGRAFFASWRNHRQADRHFGVSNRRDRFTTIAGQLADQSPAVRIAGVYAMEALADEWLETKDGRREARACLSVLCSYRRLPYDQSTRDQNQTKTIIRYERDCPEFS